MPGVKNNKAAISLVLLLLCALCLIGRENFGLREADPNAMDIYLDRGGAGLSRWLAALQTRASILMVTAHPDDEDGGMLASQSRGLGARASLLTLTRGEGGQNAMSNDMYDALGLVRTQELLNAGRYYGVQQYWGRAIDYGFSKTREEALEKWGYDRTLSDVVRVIRMTRPLVITSVFIGSPTDGHGNHQVAGQMAQEAWVAAADPKRFPEQLAEGLRPWAIPKVYERVPFFTPTKDNTIYDYATDKYVPLRFYNYIDKTWTTQKPAVTVTASEGVLQPALGVTFSQIGREGWGFQKSQNGGGVLPQPSLASVPYHRYGSRVASKDQEESFYDGLDTSLTGIATLAKGGAGFLKDGLSRLTEIVHTAAAKYQAGNPAAIAPDLAEALKQIRALRAQVQTSVLAEPGKSDVVFELSVKEDQLEKALTLALGLSMDAVIAPDKDPTSPFAGTPPTFGTAIPGQSFRVQSSLLNLGTEALTVEDMKLSGTDGTDWSIRPDAQPGAALPGRKDWRLKFSVTVPENAKITRPYYTRPDQEQAYYDLIEGQWRNLSTAPYPLAAAARVMYQGTEIQLHKVVSANGRVEGIGLLENPLLIAPAISVTVSPAAGAVPLDARSFEFSCILHSNVKGAAKGSIRLKLPQGWQATPEVIPFAFSSDGENETVSFQIAPHAIRPESYTIRAVAEYAGKTYEEGYRTVGYPGLRGYPYFRNAVYKATGVNVRTAPGLHLGFLPGTGDDVPQALRDLGIPVRVLSTGEIESGDLSGLDAIVLGVRAYAISPELRSANSHLLAYVKNGGTLVVQYNVQNFDRNYGPYPFSLGQNPEKVVDEDSKVTLLDPANPAMAWPNKISPDDFKGWEEERGHGFMQKWDPQYKALVETHDPGQDPQAGGLLVARYGKGFYIYDAFALYRQLPSGVPGAYRLLANLVSLGKNPEWK